MTLTGNWSQLTDANGSAYDPRAALKIILTDDADQGFSELWERVHHQGTLGTAAYAVVPELVALMENSPAPDWRAYALIATIDERRAASLPIPEWLAEPYALAMKNVVQPAIQHLRTSDGDLEVRSLIAVLAHAKGQQTIGAIALWTEDERLEVVG